LGDPTRRAIFERLAAGPRPVGELARGLPVSRPAVSQHLRVLKDAGLVEVRVDAQRRLYRIHPEPLAELDEWLAPYRALWTASLDRLEQHLERRRNQ
jgi:DNA-binding transcriptional ArsR family regulator